MRESRPYGSVRGARDETRVPTATECGSACGRYNFPAIRQTNRRPDDAVAPAKKATARQETRNFCLIPILRLSDLRLPNRGARWT